MLVGHQDLSQNLGIPGQYTHPQLRKATARVNALCKQREIAVAGAVNQPENAKTVIDSGAQFRLYGTDLALMRREAERAVSAVALFRQLA